MDKNAIWRQRRFTIKRNCDKPCKDFISVSDIKINNEKLSKLIGVYNITNEEAKNLSKDSINTGSEMFVVLNSCPSNFERLYWRPIYGPESRIAITALNIVKKAKEEYKAKAIKMFTKIISTLEFQHISFPNDSNGHFEKRIDVKGEMLLTLSSSISKEYLVLS